MVRINWCILLFLASGLVVGDDEPISATDEPLTRSARYYPLTVGNEYYYTAVKANAPNRELRVKAEIRNLQTVDGEDSMIIVF